MIVAVIISINLRVTRGCPRGIRVAPIRGVLPGRQAQCCARYLCHLLSPHTHPRGGTASVLLYSVAIFPRLHSQQWHSQGFEAGSRLQRLGHTCGAIEWVESGSLKGRGSRCQNAGEGWDGGDRSKLILAGYTRQGAALVILAGVLKPFAAASFTQDDLRAVGLPSGQRQPL